MTPHRIVLISNGRYEEYTANSGLSASTLYPGHLLAIQSDHTVLPHATPGGPGPVLVAEEDALQGRIITTPFVAGDMVPTRVPDKGDLLLMRLAPYQSVAEGDKLASDGLGNLTPVFGPSLYNITADSTNVTNTTAETTFSNGTYTIPARKLAAGDVLRIRGTAVVTAQNSTNTNRIKVKLGSTVLADTTALNLAAGTAVTFDLTVTVRTVGASGTYVVEGTISYGAANGTATVVAVYDDSATLDTTATAALTVTDTQSAASTGNTTKLSQFSVGGTRTAGETPIAQAGETLDNSAGTASAFIRALIL